MENKKNKSTNESQTKLSKPNKKSPINDGYTEVNKDIMSDIVMIVFKVLTIFLAVMILVPFFWVITSSFKTNLEYMRLPLVWFAEVPQFNHYFKVFIEMEFYKYMFNSLLLSGTVVVLSVAGSAFVSYGFARFKFKGKSIWFAIMLATMMFPAQVTMIPAFLIYNEMGWVGTFLPLTVPQICGSASSILLISQFMKGVPKTIDEAAKIDGANYFTIFLKIMLPQIVPILIVSGIFTFLGTWKDSMGPLIYLGGDRALYTLPLALLFFEGSAGTEYTLQLTGITISLVPTILIYIFGQKQIENNIVIVDLK